MPTLSLKVSDELDQDLAALAQRRGVSKSALIRDALTDFVALDGGTAAPSAAGDADASSAAAAAEPDEYGW